MPGAKSRQDTAGKSNVSPSGNQQWIGGTGSQ